jgi:alginate lyase
MRAILIVLLAMLPMTVAASAADHTVSLTLAEQERLRQLISSDGDARSLFHKIKATADEAKNSSPSPIKQIESEGKLESDPGKIATQRSLGDMKKVQSLALAYAGTQDKSYAKAARDYIVAWAKQNKPTGDPIDETQIEPLLFGYDLVRPTMNDEDRGTVDHWLREIASKTLSFHDPKPWTNWNSHRIKTVGLIAFILQDQELIDQAVSLYKQQVQNNLRSDGSSLDFEERDAVGYHDYDIWPLLTFAIAAQRNGIDLYNYVAPNGASLAKAVDFLRPFVEGRQSHAEFVHTSVEFDKQRAAHGEKGHGMGQAYDPKHGLPAIDAAAAFDSRLAEVARRVRGTPAKYPTIQPLLNAVRQG